MLRLDPKEAPGRASTQEHFPHGESSSQLHHRETAGQLQAGPQGHLWHCSPFGPPGFPAHLDHFQKVLEAASMFFM